MRLDVSCFIAILKATETRGIGVEVLIARSDASSTYTQLSGSLCSPISAISIFWRS